MFALLPLALITFASAPSIRPQAYLVSIVDVPLEAHDSIRGFSFSTEGVSFHAICTFPEGWKIRAGSDIRGDGVLEGEGSNGVTWLPQRNPPELENIALVAMNTAFAANSFGGSAMIAGIDGDREIALTSSNVRLTPASACSDKRVG